LPEEIAASVVPPPPSQIEPRAEALIAATGADFRIRGVRAYQTDLLNVITADSPRH
jgi:antirestriction protein ArdC